jgi:hypothetical protein
MGFFPAYIRCLFQGGQLVFPATSPVQDGDIAIGKVNTDFVLTIFPRTMIGRMAICLLSLLCFTYI